MYNETFISRTDIIKDVNYVSWKIGKVRIIEEVDSPGITTGTISYKDVLYDVDFATWKVANVRIADAEARSEVQTDGENERWFRRQYKLAVEQVRDILRPFISISEEVKDNDDNTLTFRFPEQWTGSISAMMSYIHHYVVDYILSAWFGMTLPDTASSHLAAAEAWKEKTLAEAHSEDRNVEWFDRQLSTAISHIKGRLKWCIKEGFNFPDTWKGNITSLSEYIHRYVVDYILYEWFKMNMPNEAAVYLTSAEAWEEKIINEARSEDVSNVFFRL